MNTTPPEIERRQHQRIRNIFVQACELLAPVVAANDPVKTISSFAMTHMMQDKFPHLTANEIHIVITTVEKIHREQRLHAILNKKS